MALDTLTYPVLLGVPRERGRIAQSLSGACQEYLDCFFPDPPEERRTEIEVLPKHSAESWLHLEHGNERCICEQAAM
jgi:hypothetical protein